MLRRRPGTRASGRQADGLVVAILSQRRELSARPHRMVVHGQVEQAQGQRAVSTGPQWWALSPTRLPMLERHFCYHLTGSSCVGSTVLVCVTLFVSAAVICNPCAAGKVFWHCINTSLVVSTCIQLLGPA
eukprot:jgi/Ulvmu1/12120/UM084_0046.1